MSYSWSQVAAHNKESDCWVVVDGVVYDVTKFLGEHPGGKKVLLNYGGKDATKIFHGLHSDNVLEQYGPDLKIGVVASDASSASSSSSSSSVVVAKYKQNPQNKWMYGDGVPFGDPYWYRGLPSPYYKQTHFDFRDKVRAFVETEIKPYVSEWHEQGTYPPELHEKAYKAGIYAAVWPQEYGGTPPPECDAFHDLILIDELARCGSGGVLWACFFSFGIALPPIIKVGNQYLKDKVVRDVITGKKIMSLAVTEPYAGSDVADIRCTARREGDYYIVNGEKKFITSGTKADYFTVAVRTGGKGMRGVSLLLMEKTMPGVRIRRQKTQGLWISGTGYLIFEDVKVPVKNLIGKENDGFRSIMHNFNHERFVFAALSNRYARLCIEDAAAYGRVRKTFGKRLVDHQAIRHKLAEMARHVEATHAQLEQIAFAMKNGATDRQLGGVIALVKVQATKTMEFCCREASQIFGGNCFLRGGIAARVERLYREVRFNAIAGGSEEILLDLAMRQSKL
eukprot:TRINITY_DN66815_c6_g2_i1.p1 TRINITY_DN66815_c6_g2~~TRINITY_DN66815_c6_g2_i1.p1  ORF type:complete len:509 (-),score=292.31 TRINITY_DN66815_c6_g2_i1:1380-2906(-)